MSQIGLGVLIIIIQPQRAAIKSNVQKQLKGCRLSMRYRNSAKEVSSFSEWRQEVCRGRAREADGHELGMTWQQPLLMLLLQQLLLLLHKRGGTCHGRRGARSQ